MHKLKCVNVTVLAYQVSIIVSNEKNDFNFHVPVLGPVSERRLSENSEYVNPEMRETLGFPFQNGRFVKPEKAG